LVVTPDDRCQKDETRSLAATSSLLRVKTLESSDSASVPLSRCKSTAAAAGRFAIAKVRSDPRTAWWL